MTLSRQIATVIAEKNVPAAEIVAVLKEYKLLALLPTITAHLKELAKKSGEQDVIDIETPYPLSKEAEARIKRIVGNDLAETRVTLHAELLAGFKARFKGRLYDGSAERIIRQLTTS